MATMRLWAGMHECRDVEALYGVVRALREATRFAEAAGCEAVLVEEDVGDHLVGVSGERAAIVVAAREFSERGFEPVVCAGREAEYEALDLALGEGLAHNVALELET